MAPSLLHQALSKTPVHISKQVAANVKLADPGIKIKTPSTFKVAPLASHDVIFGMPFLAENNLLIDPVTRKLLPRPCDLSNYVKVGNALMELPAPEAQLEEVNSIDEEPPEYASLNDFFRKEFPDVFTLKRGGRLPPKGGPMHRIILKDEKKPINGRLLRVPAKYYLPMRRFILENVRCGRLRPSTSYISSGTLMTPRSDPTDDPRMVHDYRQLNDNTVKDHTPIPRQDETIEMIARAKVRGKIDLPDAYYQIWMFPDDIHKTAFKTPFGLFEWTVMPQGLCNAPATFQRYMNYVLRDYIGKFCAVYLDDIAIFSNSVEEHKEHVRLILEALREHGIMASQSKSVLFADEIEFLGHRISSKGIQANPAKLDKINTYPTPRSVADIRSFLGLVNYVAMFDFIPGLADYSSVLSNLTKKNVPFRWGKEHQQAFDTIKRLARSVRFLQRLDYESGEPVWLVADASNRGVGGYVAQGKDWKTAKPIGFYSRQYRAAEFHYPTHEQEMLAIVECMKHWYPQLTGTRFEVLTDHAPLKYWKTQRDLSKRQIRWLDFLCDFDFDIKHIPGITNTAADALSRYPYAQRDELNTLSTVVIDHTEIENIKKAYPDDAFFKPIIEHPERYPQYQLLDGLLFVAKDGRLCVPDCRNTRTMLLRQHHDNENHFGIAKTRGALTALYFWPNIAKDVVTYINSCSTCLRNKSTTQAPAGFLHSLPIPQDRFADIAMDFVGPIPKCNGLDMILIMTDRLTNYVRIVPTRSTATARDIAQIVYESWYRLFGLPHSIVSDRDKLFTSHFWKELHRLLDIRIKMSTTAHPETDGSSERSNNTAIEALRSYVDRRQPDWMDHLIHVETAMNNSINATTKMTPTQLLFGTSIRLFPSFRSKVDTHVPAVAEFIERINESVAIAKDNHLAAKTVQAHHANKHRRPEPKYKVGDKVMLDSRNIHHRIKKNGRSAKFYPRFLGPFKIIQAKPETSNYKLKLYPAVDFESIHPTFHAKLLRRYTPNDPKRYPAREPARPPPLIPEDNQYEVEKILDHDRRRGYLVRWAGYDQSEDSWVSERDIHEDLVREYRAMLRK